MNLTLLCVLILISTSIRHSVVLVERPVNYNTRQRQQRASETEEETKERLKRETNRTEREERNDFCKRKGRGTKMERSKIWLF